jgi:hypothetical protein
MNPPQLITSGAGTRHEDTEENVADVLMGKGENALIAKTGIFTFSLSAYLPHYICHIQKITWPEWQ